MKIDKYNTADVFAALGEQYKSKGRLLIELEAPRLKDICVSAKIPPSDTGLQLVEDCVSEMVKSINKITNNYKDKEI